MNLEEYRTLFLAGSLAVALIAAAPTLGLVMPFPSSGKGFSELWLLGPHHMAEDYPFEIVGNQEYGVFVGVGNHMGRSEYYIVYVKLRNQTQPLPTLSDSESSPLPSLYEFRFLIADGATWESLLTFEVLDASVRGDSMFIGALSINGFALPVNSVSMWDSENSGFYYQLFFELWLYNETSKSAQFHNRFVGIWLNMTGS